MRRAASRELGLYPRAATAGRGSRAGATMALIPAGAVDDMLERQARLKTLDLAQHARGKRMRVGEGGVVRRDGYFGMAPQRACYRQRLAPKNVERCAGERAFVERGKNIGLDLQRTARGVDEVGAASGAVAFELAQKF